MPLPPYYLEVILVSGVASLGAMVMNGKASLQPKPIYCSRDYHYSSRFNQQYEKPTPFLGFFSKFYRCFANAFKQFAMEAINSIQWNHNMELNCKYIYMI